MNNDALALLLEQNRQLQAEVQALRGMVEEQGFELQKLQRDSLSRYTDTDDRLRNLETATDGQPAVAVAPDRQQDTGGGLRRADRQTRVCLPESRRLRVLILRLIWHRTRQ